MLQETYNRVKAHLLAQGRPATFQGSCVYRSPSGLKCAVGCLITDEAYDEDLEGVPVRCLYEPGTEDEDVTEAYRAMLQESGIDTSNVELLRMLSLLQRAHDDGVSDVVWNIEARLRRVAMQFNLEP